MKLDDYPAKTHISKNEKKPKRTNFTDYSDTRKNSLKNDIILKNNAQNRVNFLLQMP
jgi:hypothetical protein